MKLRELDAEFMRAIDETTSTREDVTIANADGLMFMCPKCFAANGGPIGTHSIICWFVGRVPDNRQPGPGRWQPSGTGIDDLTFVPAAPPGPQSVSVMLTGGCLAHFNIRNGAIEDLT